MKLIGGRRCKGVVLCTLTVFIVGVVYFGYFCPDQVCALSSGSPTPQYKTPFEAYLKGELPHQDFSESQLDRDYNFNIEGDDVIVYLHVQKTGGTTFGRHLVKNIQLSKPCVCHRGRKRCDCINSQKNIWLFSRHSTGWACGLHADWTELKECVNDVLDKRENSKRRRRYLYITIMRDPFMRYLSEWKHVQRGSTWLAARLHCNGRSATLEEMPFCFNTETWSGVTLEEFLACPYNLANNRLTRMLSNLSLVSCYNFTAMPPSQRDAIMLQSAKDNLRDMAFFGLTEEQRATQYMFQRTFKLKFIEDFTQRNLTHASESVLTEASRQGVLRANHLDIELYQYAKDLFFQRLRHMQEEDARNNITTNLFDPPRGDTGSQKGALVNPYGHNNNMGVRGSKRRGKSRRRHKYRTNLEVERATIEDEAGDMRGGERPPDSGGMLLPLARRVPMDDHPEQAPDQQGFPRDGQDQPVHTNSFLNSNAHLDQRQVGMLHNHLPGEREEGVDYVP